MNSLESNDRIDEVCVATGRMKHHKKTIVCTQSSPAEGAQREGENGEETSHEERNRGVRSSQNERRTNIRPDQALSRLRRVFNARPQCEASMRCVENGSWSV